MGCLRGPSKTTSANKSAYKCVSRPSYHAPNGAIPTFKAKIWSRSMPRHHGQAPRQVLSPIAPPRVKHPFASRNALIVRRKWPLPRGESTKSICKLQIPDALLRRFRETKCQKTTPPAFPTRHSQLSTFELVDAGMLTPQAML